MSIRRVTPEQRRKEKRASCWERYYPLVLSAFSSLILTSLLFYLDTNLVVKGQPIGRITSIMATLFGFLLTSFSIIISSKGESKSIGKLVDHKGLSKMIEFFQEAMLAVTGNFLFDLSILVIREFTPMNIIFTDYRWRVLLALWIFSFFLAIMSSYRVISLVYRIAFKDAKYLESKGKQ